MKITILDYATLGNDLDLSELKKEGTVHIYETTEAHQLTERIADSEIVITNKVVFGMNEMKKAKRLKMICVAATGYNNIDLKAAKKLKIVVANVSGYSTESVVQQTFAYILFFLNSVHLFNQDVKAGKWQQSPIFTMLTHSISELQNKKLGIIGFGTIGKRVAEIALTFGMQILVAKRPNVKYKDGDFRFDFDEVIRESDILTIHTPLTKESENLISATELNTMKKTAIMLNLARGGVVNEADLYDALKNKTIQAAASDVMTQEPPKDGSPLFGLDNFVATPHIAWTSIESRIELMNGLVENIQKFKRGEIKAINLVSLRLI